jgi:peptidoglycan/LPS O-acetylase OafA/YrhL
VSNLVLFTRLDAIAVGCLFAIYKDKIIAKCEPYWIFLFHLSWIVLVALRYIPNFLNNYFVNFYWSSLLSTHGIVANFLIAIIMMYSIFGPQKIWFRFLNLKAVNYIGILSYSIYLWQQLFISSSGFWMTQFPVNMVFIFLAAWFSYSFIEKPFLKIKETIAEKRKTI